MLQLEMITLGNRMQKLENDLLNFGSTTDASEQRSGKIDQNFDFMALVEKSISFIFWP